MKMDVSQDEQKKEEGWFSARFCWFFLQEYIYTVETGMENSALHLSKELTHRAEHVWSRGHLGDHMFAFALNETCTIDHMRICFRRRRCIWRCDTNI